ncbi:MAG: glycosyltransferase, partial [Dehalococcoidia bacterium]
MLKNLKEFTKKIIFRLPFRYQKFFYLAWHRIQNPPKLSFKISTTHLELSEDAERLKLVGFLKVYNEAKNGNLERVLKHLKTFCNEIVVCDCQSTDNSLEIIKKYTSHILVEPNDFKNELFTKQKMLEYVLKLNPDWIIWLDADEVFDREGEQGGIRKLCDYGNKNGIDGLSFLEINLWKSNKFYRVDEFWHKAWYVRLWKNNANLKFDLKKGLHHFQYPLGLKNIKQSNIKVIHFGFSSSELIDKKYKYYKDQGQSGYIGLERLHYDRNIELKHISPDWFPLSCSKVSVICLVYKSTEYIDFVWQSFKKYTKNADFLFVANDATEKVKNYLQAKNLPHLIFENEDKDEYYLNRVYRAWNYGGFNTSCDIIVFVNSNMAFSRNWLENLLKNLNKNRIVSSRLVESGKISNGKYAISKNLGQTYKEFNEEEFEKFAEEIKIPEIRKGGLFMPCAIY